MSYLTKRKLALIFCLGVSVAALAIVILFTAKIYKADKADAQSITTPCYPITGKTMAVKVRIGSDPPVLDDNGIANSGIIDFDDITILGENHRACVEIQNDGMLLKGWAVNKKPDGSLQLGLISFYCDGSENRDFSCTGNYQVKIDKKTGAFAGQAYNDFIGPINLSGMKLDMSNTPDNTAFVSSDSAEHWAWSDRVGWFDFTGVKIPVGVPQCIPKTTQCTVGIGACANTGTVVACNDDGSVKKCSVEPKPAGLENPETGTCTDGIDNDCDGLTDGADPDCKIVSNGNSNGNNTGNGDGGVDNGNPNGNSTNGCSNEPTADGFMCGEVVTSGNSKLRLGSGTDSFSANRETILRGVAKAKIESDGPELQTQLDLINDTDKSTYYYENTVVHVESSANITTNKTIIVNGGDIYIDSDLYNLNDKQIQIGIIALKSEWGNGGNVYIKNTVKNLQVQIFADGGVYSYKDGQQPSPPADKQCPNTEILNNDFWRQLVIEGTITSHDNILGDNNKTANSFACLRVVQQNSSGNQLIEHNNSDTRADKFNISESIDLTKSVFIFYRAPNPALPIFGGFAGTGTRQGD